MILSVDTIHLLMAREDNDVVGMKAMPQTLQSPLRLTCVFSEQSAKYKSGIADTVELYDHILGSGCPFDIWQQTRRGMSAKKEDSDLIS